MELSYYFYTDRESEDIEEILISLMKEITDENTKLKVVRKEESEEGEGDTLELICDYFSISNALQYVEEIEKEHRLKVNLCLWIYIYRDGNAKFLEFIGKLLKYTKGDAVLIEEYDSKVLERRNNTVIVNNYFFNGDFSKLEMKYLSGSYKEFTIYMEVNNSVDLIKKKVINSIKQCIGEEFTDYMDDEESTISDFGYSCDYFNIYARGEEKEGQDYWRRMALTINIIYTSIYDKRITMMVNFLNKILSDFQGECELEVKMGYLIKDCKEFILMKRENGIITVNKNEEEKNIFHNFQLPYIEGYIEIE